MMMWLGYAKSGKEIEVQEALSAEGITAHCAKAVEVKRVGKRRKPDVFIKPLLPNYIFIECDEQQYLVVTGTKHLHSTMTAIPRADASQVMRFIGRAQSVLDDRMAQIDAGERLEQFKAGDILEVLDGPLTGRTVRFRAIVEKDGEVFPSIEADMDFMGQVVRGKFDPISVRAEK